MVSATLSTGASKTSLSALHFLTWASSAIVVGITGYFLKNFPHDQHLIFEIVIAALTLGFWIPSFAAPFLRYRSYYLPLNFIFSYLWLTSFIFAAQDYNERSCVGNAPTGGRCTLKLTSEAFIFLAFIFTVFALIVDILAWKSRAAATVAGHHPDKEVRASNEATA